MKNDDGWNNHYRITHASGMRVGIMKCSNKKCGKTIRSDSYYLIKERTNFKHRGNETDECYIYHRDCSPVTNVWKAHDKELREQEKSFKIREAKRLELVAEINEWEFDNEDLFESH